MNKNDTLWLGDFKKPLAQQTLVELCEKPANAWPTIHFDKNVVEKSVRSTQKLADSPDPVYGINTGFGPLCAQKISAKDTEELQLNLIRSHSAGVGDAVALPIVRLMLLLKAQALAFGYSGVSAEIIARLLWHAKSGIAPHIPQQGSVGASGDLAPLSHMSLPLFGEGLLWDGKKFSPTKTVLKKHKLKPVTLGPKAGLGLCNGTQFMQAHGVFLAQRMAALLDTADMIAALSLEALMGSAQPFAKELHEIRPHLHCQNVAHQIRMFLEGSKILIAHENCERVQDPYSLRCIPQIHGASRAAWQTLSDTLHIEINSVTDNPIVFSDTKALSGGLFHGQPLALPFDYAALALSELGNVSDRRCELLLQGRDGLPKLLTKNPGLNSGFMIAQYTSAALASENKTLCFPASADSIPTGLGQEDHVSMGSIGVRKALEILKNTEAILGIELVLAAQALDFRRPLRSGPILEAVHETIRLHIKSQHRDANLSNLLESGASLVRSQKLLTLAKNLAQKNKFKWKGCTS